MTTSNRASGNGRDSADASTPVAPRATAGASIGALWSREITDAPSCWISRVIEPVPAAMSSATSPGRGAIAFTMRARQRPSCPKLRIRAQRSYPGARGANSPRAMRGGVAITGATVPIDGGPDPLRSHPRRVPRSGGGHRGEHHRGGPARGTLGEPAPTCHHPASGHPCPRLRPGRNFRRCGASSLLGPRTTVDVVIQVLMVALLIAGLIVTVRTPRSVSGRVTLGI